MQPCTGCGGSYIGSSPRCEDCRARGRAAADQLLEEVAAIAAGTPPEACCSAAGFWERIPVAEAVTAALLKPFAELDSSEPPVPEWALMRAMARRGPEAIAEVLVQGGILQTLAEDILKAAKAWDELSKVAQRLLGPWESLHSGFRYEVKESEGILCYAHDGVQAELQPQGAWLVADCPGYSVRLRAGPACTGLACQQKAHGAEEWSKPLYAARPSALVAGAELVTTTAAMLWRSPEVSEGVAVAPLGTRLVAAGPVVTDSRGARLLPLKPHGHAVWAAHVCPLDAAEALEVGGGDGAGELAAGAAPARYTHLGSLLEALTGGDTVLLRGTWLRDQAERGAVLPRRQELPREAAWAPEELGPLLRGREVQVVAVSHCWLTAEHPDPEGKQLRRLGHALGMRLAERTMPIQDLAVFVDWCSLYQKPRDTEQAAAFGRSLEAADLWYAHAATTVVALTQVPADVVQYHARGWPLFECAVGGLLKGGNQLLDLGLQRSPTEWLDLATQCATKRRPPMTPSTFATEFKSRRLSDKDDESFLAGKYRETYEQVLHHTSALDFSGLGWGAEEARLLSEVLPDCVALKKLVLRDNSLGADAMTFLAAALPQCPRLQELWIDGTAIGDRGVYILAEALPRCPRLRLLQVQGAGLGPEGVASLLAALPRCTRLEALGLAGNSFGSLGAEALLDVLAASQGDALRTLHLQRVGLAEADRQQLRAAWEAAGKDPEHLHF